MREKLQQLIVELNKNLVGKEAVMKLSLLTMLAGENLILFGPPGTAKSEIARRLSKVFEEDSYFEYLLTKFTTPEEIFGPLSIQELKADRFRRNVEGYMPNVKIAFLDEIFKANSSILNSLLTIINEKVYHNGNEKIKVPLQSLISASNELPIGDNELSALYDRFLVRVVVDYLADDDVEELFDVEDEEFKITDSLKMKIKEIEKIKQEAKGVEIPEEIRACIMEIRKEFNNVFKEDKDEVFSDRKFVKIMKFLKVSAYTNGRDKVDLSDVMLLINCLWNRDNNAPKLSSIITKVVQSHVSIKTTDLITSTKRDKKKDSKKTNFDFKGEGTEYNPFLIEDINDLIHINNPDYLGKGYYFEQTGDIDLSSIENWISIGEREETPFVGHYNGTNFKILNLKGDSGLFGVINEASSISNLGLENTEIKGGGFIGALVNINKGLINDCYSTGNVSSSSSSGGLVGLNKSGSIENCKNSADISSPLSGGIAGHNNGKIKNCSNAGNVNSIFSYSSSGGIVGYNKNGSIENCDNLGNISSATNSSTIHSSPFFSNSGGIAGKNENGNIKNCYNTGNISSATSSSINTFSSSSSSSGGIVGDNVGNIKNCYNTGNINSASSVTFYSTTSGGIIGCNRSGRIENCYNTGDINSSSISGGIVGSNTGSINTCIAINIKIEGKNIGKISGSSLRGSYTNCYANQELNGEYNNNCINLPLGSMNEKFFSRLGWDFDNIWTWDNTENRPILDLTTQKTTQASNGKKAIEISTSKDDINIFKENIWL